MITRFLLDKIRSNRDIILLSSGDVWQAIVDRSLIFESLAAASVEPVAASDDVTRVGSIVARVLDALSDDASRAPDVAASAVSLLGDIPTVG